MGERPLTDADYDRLADALNRFHGECAMNLEQLDGFFAALICGPDPSQRVLARDLGRRRDG